MRLARRAFLMASVCVTLAFAGLHGCSDPDTGIPARAAAGSNGSASAAPSGGPKDGLQGGVGTGSPLPSANPSSTASPTQPPSPTATPAPYASSVTISPLSVRISVPPGAGVDPSAGYLTTAHLSATVKMSDGTTATDVTWTSLAPAIATVEATGLVTAVGPGSGAEPWTVSIKAVSADGKATAVRSVTVTAQGDVAISVQ